MPLGKGWGIFHPRFSPHHRLTATSSMSAACQITRQAGAGSTNTTTGEWTPPARTVIYTGPCRVQVATIIGGEKLHDVGEAQETVRRYHVSITWDGQPRVDDEIVLTGGVDPTLAGRRLRVTTVEMASQQWQRDFMAEEVEAIR